MTDLPDRLPPTSPQQPPEPLIEVEVLPAELEREPVRRGVTLSGEAARNVRDSLGLAVIESTKAGLRAADSTLRLVPSEKTAQGLANGSLRWATASNGDASVLIKDTATGRIAGHGHLQKVKLSPLKVLGPAAWEAMAMATQQHYLVEINEKLQTIDKGVSEVVSRIDDAALGTLTHVHKTVLTSRERVDDGRALSEGRVQELRDGAQRAGEVWHQLHERMKRHLSDYGAGTASAGEVEGSWALLLHATQVVGESSALLSALPYDTVAALEDATSEERERVLDLVENVRELAGELHATHRDWAARNADWDLRRTRNPVRKAVRAARKDRVVKPEQARLDDATAWRASQLAAPPRPPAALLVSVNEDGTVAIAAEPAANGTLV
jgi:hypothetical protein